VEGLRRGFNTRKTYDKEYRRTQLKQLKLFLEEHEEDVMDALKQDLSKPRGESFILETGTIYGDLLGAIRDLDEWMSPQPVEKDLSTWLQFNKPFTVAEPHGVVAIFGAWNYPIQLVLLPLIGAIAAGNAVLVKPSEVSVTSSNLFSKHLPKYLDAECYRVVSGGVEVGKKILEQHFDHIFYTGSTRIGRIVMEAAAKNLTPVTLELGGKSPAIVMDDVNVKVAAKRITWAKCANAGQTCIAPDYVLCHSKVKDKFVKGMEKALETFFKGDVEKSPDYGRLVNRMHFGRLNGLLKTTRGKILLGGEANEEEKFIAPTLVEVKEDDPLMENELFGPILPILTVDSIEDTVQFVRAREKPLALYLFTDSQHNRDQITTYTSSGAICYNDCLLHAGVRSLPFGGVGHSGIGAYHGKHTFDTFSHQKPCLKTLTAMDFLANGRYPPYSAANVKFIKVMLTPRKFGYLKYLLYLIGIAILYFVSTCEWLHFTIIL
jgi:aldehyde dehydrogenase (NAD+)